MVEASHFTPRPAAYQLSDSWPTASRTCSWSWLLGVGSDQASSCQPCSSDRHQLEQGWVHGVTHPAGHQTRRDKVSPIKTGIRTATARFSVTNPFQ